MHPTIAVITRTHNLGVQSPLLAAGLVKAEIRRLARAQGLAVWNRPSGSCLLTRLPHGATVTEAALRRIDAGEGLLRSLGFLQLRLRSHGELARIEVPPEDLPRLLEAELRTVVVTHLRQGFPITPRASIIPSKFELSIF